jgi:hypothetical protein
MAKEQDRSLCHCLCTRIAKRTIHLLNVKRLNVNDFEQQQAECVDRLNVKSLNVDRLNMDRLNVKTIPNVEYYPTSNTIQCRNG